MASTDSPARGGLPYALGAYFIWGLLPLYMALVRHVPALEFLSWRVIFTLPVCLVIIIAGRQVAKLVEAIRSPRIVGLLMLSAVLIGGNWLVYILAIQQGHVVAASLGYYISPMLNVLAGTLLLGERLTRAQWIAVALAAAGVSLLAWDAGGTLWVSMGLAVSFSAYGLVRRHAPVASLPGLTIETLVLAIPAAAMIAWRTAHGEPLSLGVSAGQDTVLALAGVVTAVPLLLFTVAARRMDYSLLGFIQFIAPTLIFILGVTVFHEPLQDVQVACFTLIWIAIAVFVWDLWRRREIKPDASSA